MIFKGFGEKSLSGNGLIRWVMVEWVVVVAKIAEGSVIVMLHLLHICNSNRPHHALVDVVTENVITIIKIF